MRTKRSRGQAMVETAITVALMAVATISVVTLFGNNLRSVFGASAQALAGDVALTNPAQRNIPAGITSRTLRDFAENQSGGTSGGKSPEPGGGIGGGGAPPNAAGGGGGGGAGSANTPAPPASSRGMSGGPGAGTSASDQTW